MLLSLLGVLICGTFLCFHGISIYVSVASKKLKKSRFMLLALYLSYSDFAIGLEGVYLYILKLTYQNTYAHNLQCMFLSHLVSGTIIASLLQTVLICLDRLHATFSTKIRTLEILTGNISVGLCFVLSHIFAILRGIILLVLKGGGSACNTTKTVTPITFFTFDIIVDILVLGIAIIYGFVIHRIVKQQRTIANAAVNQSSHQVKAGERKRKAMITLAWIIAITIISTAPRSIAGITAVLGNGSLNENASKIVNLFIFLNPLFDPVIYFFRIPEYRDRLTCYRCKMANAMLSSDGTQTSTTQTGDASGSRT